MLKGLWGAPAPCSAVHRVTECCGPCSASAPITAMRACVCGSLARHTHDTAISALVYFQMCPINQVSYSTRCTTSSAHARPQRTHESWAQFPAGSLWGSNWRRAVQPGGGCHPLVPQNGLALLCVHHCGCVHPGPAAPSVSPPALLRTAGCAAALAWCCKEAWCGCSGDLQGLQWPRL